MSTIKATVNVAPGATHYSTDAQYGQVSFFKKPKNTWYKFDCFHYCWVQIRGSLVQLEKLVPINEND